MKPNPLQPVPPSPIVQVHQPKRRKLVIDWNNLRNLRHEEPEVVSECQAGPEKKPIQLPLRPMQISAPSEMSQVSDDQLDEMIIRQRKMLKYVLPDNGTKVRNYIKSLEAEKERRRLIQRDVPRSDKPENSTSFCGIATGSNHLDYLKKLMDNKMAEAKTSATTSAPPKKAPVKKSGAKTKAVPKKVAGENDPPPFGSVLELEVPSRKRKVPEEKSLDSATAEGPVAEKHLDEIDADAMDVDLSQFSDDQLDETIIWQRKLLKLVSPENGTKVRNYIKLLEDKKESRRLVVQRDVGRSDKPENSTSYCGIATASNCVAYFKKLMDKKMAEAKTSATTSAPPKKAPAKRSGAKTGAVPKKVASENDPPPSGSVLALKACSRKRKVSEEKTPDSAAADGLVAEKHFDEIDADAMDVIPTAEESWPSQGLHLGLSEPGKLPHTFQGLSQLALEKRRVMRKTLYDPYTKVLIPSTLSTEKTSVTVEKLSSGSSTDEGPAQPGYLYEDNGPIEAEECPEDWVARHARKRTRRDQHFPGQIPHEPAWNIAEDDNIFVPDAGPAAFAMGKGIITPTMQSYLTSQFPSEETISSYLMTVSAQQLALSTNLHMHHIEREVQLTSAQEKLTKAEQALAVSLVRRKSSQVKVKTFVDGYSKIQVDFRGMKTSIMDIMSEFSTFMMEVGSQILGAFKVAHVSASTSATRVSELEEVHSTEVAFLKAQLEPAQAEIARLELDLRKSEQARKEANDMAAVGFQNGFCLARYQVQAKNPDMHLGYLDYRNVPPDDTWSSFNLLLPHDPVSGPATPGDTEGEYMTEEEGEEG